MADAAKSSSGSMMAVQAASENIGPVLSHFAPDLVLANDNGPSQVVLSGPTDVVTKALEMCAEVGFKARLLPVATAFHSKIVASAVEPFESALKKLRLRKPSLPVYANATAEPYSCTGTQMATEVSSQLASPVRFRELVERMYSDGARIFIEIGPGSVVTGLVDDVLGARPHKSYSMDNKRTNGVTQFLSTLGALSVSGIPVDFATLFESLPAEPPRAAPAKHAVMISGANYGKPYPPANGAAGKARPNPENASAVTPDRTTPNSAPTSSISSPQEPAMPDSSYSSFPSLPSYEPSGPTGETPAERVLMEVSRRHSEFLNMASSAHAAYLNTVTQVMGGGATPHTEQVRALPRPAPVTAERKAPAQRPVEPAVADASVSSQPAPPKAVQPAPAPQSAPAAVATPMASPSAVASEKPAAVQKPAGVNTVALVRGIIADKTGYPEDMLDVDMDLEGELGVDSIKQVEILSTIREQMPELPEIDPERLVELRTIAAIADMVSGSSTPAPQPVAQAPVPITAPATPKPAVSAPTKINGVVTPDIVRALIADKTGYPSDMLEDDMDLEGELGVDSIKQVEILSALREQHPDLPEVDPEVLVELRTIRAIADFFA